MRAFYSFLAVCLALSCEARARARIPKNDCSSQIGSCAYYRCEGERLKCDEDSRLLSIGEPICADYVADENSFSSAGRAFLDEVRPCLEQAIENANPATCAQADEAFVEAHVSCYVRHGYCELDSSDKSGIAEIAAPAAADIELALAWLDIQTRCLGN